MRKNLLFTGALFASLLIGGNASAQLNQAKVIGDIATKVTPINYRDANVFYSEDFEAAAATEALPDGWVQKRTSALTDAPTADAADPKWFLNCATHTFTGSPYTDYTHNSSEGSLATGYTAENFTWAITPEINLSEATSATLRYWAWYTCDGGSGYYTSKYHVAVFADDTWTVKLTFVDAENNQWDSEISADLSEYAGKVIKLAFIYEYSDGYQMAIDDISIDGGSLNAIENNVVENAISVFPVPARDVLNVATSSNFTKCEIYNVVGQVISRVDVASNNFQINTSELEKGVYFIRLSGNGTTSVAKFIVR